MATSFEKLSYSKDWNNTSDFPTYEENETRVRADMQLLHDEVKDFINEKLIPGIETLAVPGAGDMRSDVYDPTGMMQDIFAYARAQAAGAVSAARTNTESAVSEYDTEQTAKFDKVDIRLTAAETVLKNTMGAIALLKEYKTAGTYTVELPADTVAVYALAVGAGGGGGKGYNYISSESAQQNQYYGGGGGAGGNASFIGPILPENISDLSVVVGAGGAGGSSGQGETGGASSVFGLAVSGGNGGGGSREYANRAGTQGETTGNEMRGASGGGGASYVYSSITSGLSATSGGVGSASDGFIPIIMGRFSAGGGGGGCREATAGNAGGTCLFGSGGKGGAYNSVGSVGGQCCGGGGGGSGTSSGGYAGGKGGDGYVAIWVQRAGLA